MLHAGIAVMDKSVAAVVMIVQALAWFHHVGRTHRYNFVQLMRN
jgi:hypothetical protein